MARSLNQRSVRNDSAATRANAHKLERPVGTWSTVHHQYQGLGYVRADPNLSPSAQFSVGANNESSAGICGRTGLGLLSAGPARTSVVDCSSRSSRGPRMTLVSLDLTSEYRRAGPQRLPPLVCAP